MKYPGDRSFFITDIRRKFKLSTDMWMIMQ